MALVFGDNLVVRRPTYATYGVGALCTLATVAAQKAPYLSFVPLKFSLTPRFRSTRC
jgi:hypothetical protein